MFEARQEVNALKFYFIFKDTLPLHEYIEKKVMLLREANIINKIEIIYYI